MYKSYVKDRFFANQFTRKYVEEQIVQDFVAYHYESYLMGSLNIHAKVKDKIKELRTFSEKYTVVMPIGGIRLDGMRSLKIGNVKIGFFRKRKFPFRELRKFPRLSSFLEGLEGQLVGIVEVEGETLKANEKALSEVSKALNAVRLYVLTFHSRSSDVQIRIMPEIMIGRTGPTLLDRTKKDILYSGEQRAGVMPFVINNENLKKMRSLRFDDVKSLLKKGPIELSPFERELLLAINWYGVAVDMTDSVLKFLNYAIVLEVLVSKQEKDSDRTITDKLAEGVAFLLGRGYNNRVKIKRDIKTLYGIRSSIVHRGKQSVEVKHLRLIEYVALILILELLKKRKEFPTKRDLLEWIEKRRLR